MTCPAAEPPDDLSDLHRFETPDEAFQYVRMAGMQEDAQMDLGETALALGLLFLPGVKPERFRHHLKKRLIESEEYAQAVIVVEAMEALAPDEHRTLFDKGILYAKLGQQGQAKTALERYIEKAPNPADKQQARMLLLQIMSTPV